MILRRRAAGAGTALAALLLLGACAGGPDTAPPAAASATPSTIVPAPIPPSRPVAVIVPPPAPPAPPRRLGTADLVGRSSTELAVMFGQPALLKREPPAEVWQYAGGRCTLLAFLYPVGGGLQVRHVETVDRRPADPVLPADCLDSLLKGRPPALS